VWSNWFFLSNWVFQFEIDDTSKTHLWDWF
jgi:hypothetical protein